MSVDAIGKGGNGVQSANAVCDDCGRSQAFACGYASEGKPEEGQVIKKATQQGWAFVKKTLRCPSCEAKRKVVNMSKVKAEKKSEEMSREPSRAQRRDIIEAIAAVYDTDKERYTGSYTDRVVAEEIGGGVMPGWVAKIRDENYGPAGGNEETVALATQLSEFADQADKVVQAAKAQMQADVSCAIEKFEKTVEKKMAEVSAFRARIERVEKSADMRVAR